MKPFRIVLAHDLIKSYGMYKHMTVYQPLIPTTDDIMKFHSPEYVKFLRSNSFRTMDDTEFLQKFNVGAGDNDCPLFPGVYQFSQISTGGSLSAAANIILGRSDIAINWAGGLHHAKKSQAHGFCYINDIVLCILELLKYYSRVLYIDLDVHHGDGVEEAFYTTDRVMTVSFHRFGDHFFPGTGGFDDIGAGDGKNYSLNVPLNSGITDRNYQFVFQTIMTRVMEVYNPSVIVLQCGADSISGDRLGDFNLSSRGHGSCVEFMCNYNIPLILLGKFSSKCFNK